VRDWGLRTAMPGTRRSSSPRTTVTTVAASADAAVCSRSCPWFGLVVTYWYVAVRVSAVAVGHRHLAL